MSIYSNCCNKIISDMDLTGLCPQCLEPCGIYKDCPDCFEGFNEIPCKTCLGSNYVGEGTECQHCDWDGYTLETCKTCKGEGYVDDE